MAEEHCNEDAVPSDDDTSSPTMSEEWSLRHPRLPHVDENSVFVGNVDYAISIDDLRAIFCTCGPIVCITMPMNNCGVPKGYAFIEFQRPDCVSSAIQLTGSIIGRRRIKVAAKRSNVPGFLGARNQRAHPFFGNSYNPLDFDGGAVPAAVYANQEPPGAGDGPSTSRAASQLFSSGSANGREEIDGPSCSGTRLSPRFTPMHLLPGAAREHAHFGRRSDDRSPPM